MAEETVSILAVLKDQVTHPAEGVSKALEGISGAVEKVNGVLEPLTDRFAGLIAGFASYETIQKSIEAFKEHEQTLTAFKSALGDAADEFDRLKEKAEEYQQTTTNTADSVTRLQTALLNRDVSLGNLDKSTQASIQLAARMGTSLEQAGAQIAITYQGIVPRSIKRVIPELQSLTVEQLRAGAAADLIAKKFSGSAEDRAATASGRLQQAQNRLEDSYAKLGKTFTTISAEIMPKVVDAFERLAGYLESDTGQKYLHLVGDVIVAFVQWSDKIVLVILGLKGLGVAINILGRGPTGLITIATAAGAALGLLIDKLTGADAGFKNWADFKKLVGDVFDRIKDGTLSFSTFVDSVKLQLEVIGKYFKLYLLDVPKMYLQEFFDTVNEFSTRMQNDPGPLGDMWRGYLKFNSAVGKGAQALSQGFVKGITSGSLSRTSEDEYNAEEAAIPEESPAVRAADDRRQRQLALAMQLYSAVKGPGGNITGIYPGGPGLSPQDMFSYTGKREEDGTLLETINQNTALQNTLLKLITQHPETFENAKKLAGVSPLPTIWDHDAVMKLLGASPTQVTSPNQAPTGQSSIADRIKDAEDKITAFANDQQAKQTNQLIQQKAKDAYDRVKAILGGAAEGTKQWFQMMLTIEHQQVGEQGKKDAETLKQATIDAALEAGKTVSDVTLEAREALRKRISRARADIEDQGTEDTPAARAKREEAALEEQYKNEIITVTDYLAKKRELTERDTLASLAANKEARDANEKTLAQHPDDAQTNALLTKKAELLEQLNREQGTLNDEEQKYRDLVFDAAQKSFAQAQSDLSKGTGTIDKEYARGVVNDAEAQEARNQLVDQFNNKTEESLALVRQLIAEQTDPNKKAQLEQVYEDESQAAYDALAKVKNTAPYFAEGIRTGLQQPMEGFFSSVIQGTKTVQSAFADMLKAIAGKLADFAASQIVTDLLGKSSSGGSSGTGWIGSVAGLIAAAFGGGGGESWGGVSSTGGDFAEGGVVPGGPGSPGIDNVRAWLTPHEYVMTRRAHLHYGTAAMDAVRAGVVPRSVLSAYSRSGARRISGGGVAGRFDAGGPVGIAGRGESRVIAAIVPPTEEHAHNILNNPAAINVLANIMSQNRGKFNGALGSRG